MSSETEYKLIVGEIRYSHVETGYWTVVDNEQTFRIADIPSQLKMDSLKVAIMAQLLNDEVSIYGTTLNIKIIEFKILT